MHWIPLAGFLLAVLPLVMTPGASFTLATQRSLSGQRHATACVVAGTATGIYLHALHAAAGLSVLVMRSAEAFAAVKIIGGAYLVGLGLYTLWRTRRRATPSDPAAPRRLPWAGHHAYPQAVLANVLNPKAASVYLTLAPQFLSAEQMSVPAMLALASVHVTAMAAWITCWALVLRTGRRVTQSDQFKTLVNRLGGAILVGLGLRTATT